MFDKKIFSAINGKLRSVILSLVVVGLIFFLLAVAILFFPEILVMLFVIGFLTFSFIAFLLAVKIDGIRQHFEDISLFLGGKRKK